MVADFSSSREFRRTDGRRLAHRRRPCGPNEFGPTNRFSVARNLMPLWARIHSRASCRPAVRMDSDLQHPDPLNARIHSRIQYVPGYAPPSSRMFCPTRYDACTLQMNAQTAPRSPASPRRPAGIESMAAWRASASVLPLPFARASKVFTSRSVSIDPGSRLLIVTLCRATLRASPATKPVRPLRAPLDKPRISIGALTEDG